MKNILIECFEKAAVEFPTNPALKYKDKIVLYERLSLEVNEIAARIYEKIGSGGCVAIRCEHPVLIAICILGVLKSANAYLPLDPALSSERASAMLSDGSVRLILNESAAGSTNLYENPVINLDKRTHTGKIIENPDYGVTELAYQLYTSGTTGKPKGVMVTCEGLMNYIDWRIRYYELSSRDRTLQPLSFSFDAYAVNFYACLFTGGCLYLIDAVQRLDYQYVTRLLDEEKITNVSLTPQLFQILAQASRGGASSLKFVTFGGEAVSPTMLYEFTAKYPNVTFYNEYGPTECTITATCGRLDAANPVTIGKPIDNVTVTVRDERGIKVPNGQPGEIWIGGAGVAKGYCGTQNSENSPFCYDPLQKQRLYRSGDFGKFNESGELMWLGRKDRQIKVRGFRIELAEIEAVLEDDPQVVLARVMYQNNHPLTAFLILRKDTTMENVRQRLALLLPEYMLPEQYVKVESFPINEQGKVDTEQLWRLADRTVLPAAVSRDPIIKELGAIWAEVLQIETPDIYTNFFDLGGNSLLVLKVHLQIDLLYPNAVKIPDLFVYTTIATLAEKIQEQGE